VEAFLAGAVAGYGIAIPVGAIGAYLVALTARTSFRVGGAAALGVASADGLYALVAVLGGAALATVVAGVAEPLRWLAVAVLLGLAARIAVLAFREYHHPHTRRVTGGLTRPGSAYLVLLGATLLNPTTVVYFAALVVGARAGAFDGGAAGTAFVAGAFLASASWQLLLAGSGAALGHVLTGPRGRLATGLVSAVIVAGLAALTALG
jgi:arginine exporter protein ArgO